MSSPNKVTRLPGGKLFCKSCRIAIPETEWAVHELDQLHIEKRGPSDPLADETPITSVPVSQDIAISPVTSASRLPTKSIEKSVLPTSAEEYLPDSFFDESPEASVEDVGLTVAEDEDLKEDRRAEMESTIRSALKKRARSCEDSDDDDEYDFDWRRKKL